MVVQDAFRGLYAKLASLFIFFNYHWKLKSHNYEFLLYLRTIFSLLLILLLLRYLCNVVRMTLNCSIRYLIFGACLRLLCLLFDCNRQRLLLLFRVPMCLLLWFLLYNSLGWHWFNCYWLMFDFWLDYLLREMLRVWWRQILVSYIVLRRRCEYRLITILKHLAVLLLFLEVDFGGHVWHWCAWYANTFHSAHHWLHDDMLLMLLVLWMLWGYCSRDHMLRRHYHLDSFFMLVESVPNFDNITLVLFHWFVR